MDHQTPIADTGFVVCVIDIKDQRHDACLREYLSLCSIYLPQTVLAEVAFLLRREVSEKSVVDFLRNLPKSRFRLTPLEPEDVSRTAYILDKYADSRIDFVDATVIAMAERLNCVTILTLDRRDFTLYKPESRDAFAILP